MRLEWRERFPRHRLQRKPLVSDPGMHRGTCLKLVSWCMPGSLTRSGGENVPGIPGACATSNFTYLVRGPLWWEKSLKLLIRRGRVTHICVCKLCYHWFRWWYIDSAALNHWLNQWLLIRHIWTNLKFGLGYTLGTLKWIWKCQQNSAHFAMASINAPHINYTIYRLGLCVLVGVCTVMSAYRMASVAMSTRGNSSLHIAHLTDVVYV